MSDQTEALAGWELGPFFLPRSPAFSCMADAPIVFHDLFYTSFENNESMALAKCRQDYSVCGHVFHWWTFFVLCIFMSSFLNFLSNCFLVLQISYVFNQLEVSLLAYFILLHCLIFNWSLSECAHRCIEWRFIEKIGKFLNRRASIVWFQFPIPLTTCLIYSSG